MLYYPYVKSWRNPEPEKKKKVGGQPGHPGVSRSLRPVTEVKTIKDYKPEQCRHCGQPLSGEDAEPHRHQVTDIPAVVAEVVEHRLHTLRCEHSTRSLVISVSRAGVGSMNGLVGVG